MAQKTLNAFVVIGGRVDNTFGQIGTQLINLGSTVDEISQKLINFGKESLEVYKDYEYNMTELETVWGTNGTFQKGSRELRSAMDDMKNAAAEWASTNIFHTNDISNAMVEAAHAGWDYQQMLEGVPAAMAMAQSGSMDLSTAMNYVLKAQKSFGWEFDDITEKMDEWIYAANKSAGTTSEFGDTFLKLGSTVRFAENTEELLALTKVMHDMGTTGSAAGTMIKTSLMRLYAPSGKASKVLEQLGVSAEEIKDMGIMEDHGLMEALDTLEAHGFSAFDSATGQAKPVLQTYSDLGQALIGITGYTQEANETQQQFYERVLKNQSVMGIMSEVFGIRGIQGSMNILMSLQEATELYGDLTNDAASGTTEYVRETMNDTLYGKTELFLSKVEELHRKVGEELAPDIEKIQGWIGGIIDDVTGMDDTQFSSIVSGLKTIAIAGPGLLIAGSAMRFIGMLLTPAGLVGMGAVTLAAIVSSLNEIQEMDFKSQFGNMHLDENTLGEYVKGLGEDFKEAFSSVNSFADALDASVKNYETASSTFSGDLLSAVLTKKQFTPEEREALEQKGVEIYSEVLKAINASGDMAAEFWTAMYGGEGTAEYDPKYQQIIDLIGEGQQGLVDQANGVAEKMKAAMLKGFEDGFTDEDYATILKYFEEYNELISEAQYEAANEEMFIQQQKAYHKAQTAGLEDIRGIAKTATEQRDSALAELEDNYLTQRFSLVYRAKKSGMTDAEAEAYVASMGVDERYEAMRNEYSANFDEFLLTLWQTQTQQSDLADAYTALGAYANLYLGGDMNAEEAMVQITKEMGRSKYAGDALGTATSEKAMLGKVMGLMVESLGGEESLAEKIEYHRQAGNTAMADKLLGVLAMEQLANGFSDIIRTDRPVWDFVGMTADFATSAMGSDAFDAYYGGEVSQRNMEQLESLRQTAEEIGPVNMDVAFPNAVNEAAEIHRLMEQKFSAITQYVHIVPSDSGTIRGGSQSALFMPRVALQAKGGRETQPSIFAEAGIPEWYIPEEHTNNTLDLVLAAAYGSGFSIFDLAERAGARMFAEGGTDGGGSLNWSTLPSSSSNGGGRNDSDFGNSITVQYSPVIHADNAQGVESVLMADKKRLEKWMEEWWTRRQLYESMVAYQ